MIDKEGVLVERTADFGIILEKSYTLSLVYDYLRSAKDVSDLSINLNPIWGENILYFSFKKKPIVVLSAKGAPVGANAVERIRRTGGKHIIFIGTSGSTDETIQDGAYVLSTAAVRDEGVTSGYLDMRVPALSDRHLTTLLQEELGKLGESTLLGVTFTTDKRYKERPDELRKLYRTANVLNIDMETSAVILIATYYGIPVAVVKVITDCAVKPVEGELQGVFDREKDFSSFVNPRILSAFAAALNVTSLVE